ncbi:hypothetical protein MLD38_005570 [Melastoma candidum]|uniref:Uncharacterized protein n=1 Tax=Melastoma candidum TaxID=119954 RepID=A0ACB9RLC5_9MYRT|nr:hypothetical protein MLD38_005570 [Melastoma candidum]
MTIHRPRRKPRKGKKLFGRKRKDRITTTPLVKKYWLQRYNLFSRYDEGILLDEEGWYSVTPEEVAAKQAKRCPGKAVLDCFAGVGGNAIQFAKRCPFVVAIDVDPDKIAMAVNNSKVYEVADCIDFVIGDFFQLAPSLKGDVVFLAPPWGGPKYKEKTRYTLDLLKPRDGHTLFHAAQVVTPNIIMSLPRNVDLTQVEELSWLSSPPLDVEVEENCVNGRIKCVTAYFGAITQKASCKDSAAMILCNFRMSLDGSTSA